MNLKQRIEKTLNDLFPINRSLTGCGVRKTLDYIKDNFLPDGDIKSIHSGTTVFDWQVPDEWNINDGYVKNALGEKIINFADNNLHVVSYSTPVEKIIEKDELLKHLHTLPKYPDRIPYRTSYYRKDWGFCCPHNLVESDKFVGPFKVKIESQHNSEGNLNWIECLKRGDKAEEILISTYCCHPNLANDNLSGLIGALFLFEYLKEIKTKYSYRLVIVPETIGAISFLSQAQTENILGGMILTCIAGPDELSIKEGFDEDSWINKAAHLALKDVVGASYKTYPFVPDGSDERQYSSPGFRIVTPSIHKSKYYEYDEYHTSADDLNFISAEALITSLEAHRRWINHMESYCFPKRTQLHCETQLGKRDLYPDLGGTLNQSAHLSNDQGNQNRIFDFNNEVQITGNHINAFNWLMHLADGTISNFEIAERSDIDINIINESIAAMYQKGLVIL